MCTCVHAFIIFCGAYRLCGVYRLNSCLAALQVALVVAQRREWQVVWYLALSSEHWSAESSQDGQEEER